MEQETHRVSRLGTKATDSSEQESTTSKSTPTPEGPQCESSVSISGASPADSTPTPEGPQRESVSISDASPADSAH